jgi:hypothetical protein
MPQGVRRLRSMEKLSSKVKKSTTSEVTALETLEKSVQELSRRLQIVENNLRDRDNLIIELNNGLDELYYERPCC